MKAVRSLVIMGLVLLSIAVTTPDIAMAMNPSTALAAPTLLSPANGAIVSPNPTLSWRAVPGAARYHIQVAGGTYFDQQYNFIESWSLTSTSYRISGHPEAYNPHLYWRVQAIDANNVQGPWSQTSQFTIK
jgi:hypothetical protein